MSSINRAFFFEQVRNNLFGRSLSQKQVDGMSAMLDYWEANHAARDDRWLAYLLGTAFHETDRKMQPIHEYGGPAYFNRRYSPPPTGQSAKTARDLGNLMQDDGNRFHGRGFVQLTGRRNYTDWSDRLGIDLVGNPDLALGLSVSTKILFEGAIGGTFTGRRLSQYFAPGVDEWIQARRVINGLDKAYNIAGYGKHFYGAISYTL